MNKNEKNSKYAEENTSLGIKIALILTAVAVVVVLAYSILNSAGMLARMTTAYTIGDDKVSVMEMNVHYGDVRNNILNTYGELIQMYGYSVNSTLEAQQCIFDSSMTWREYFLKNAVDQMQQTHILYAEGHKAGFVHDTASDLENYQQAIKRNAEKLNISVSDYVSAAYGGGVKLKDVLKTYDLRYYANAYYYEKYDTTEITDQYVQDEYDRTPAQYDLVDNYFYAFPYESVTYNAADTSEGAPKSEEEAKAQTEAARQKAEDDANAVLADIKAGKSFDDAIRAHLDEGLSFTTALHEGETITASTARIKWLANTERQPGDVDVIEDADSESYIVDQFVERYHDAGRTVSVRHILLSTEATDTEGMTAEEIAAAEQYNAQQKSEIEDIWADWKTDPTEEHFAQLAMVYSEDGGSSMRGGLCARFNEGTMVEEFENWAFDESRQPGDTEIVETEYGYHLMYFVSDDGEAWWNKAYNAAQNTMYNAFYNGRVGAYPITEHPVGINMIASN